MINQQTLIIGANSELAQALYTRLLENPTMAITLISRDLSAYSDLTRQHVQRILIEDYQAESIGQAVEEIQCSSSAPITQVFICNGLLHNDVTQPEKRLEDFNAQSFQTILTANTLTPMLWIQKLMPLLKGKSPCKLVVFSARVGSISDNRLGGWYSYRSSKAALNMLLKTTAIEFARRAKNVKIIAFHPGTTDTPLSKPFQKNVPEGKLFSADFVASQLLSIVERTFVDGKASYLDWKGDNIDW